MACTPRSRETASHARGLRPHHSSDQASLAPTLHAHHRRDAKGSWPRVHSSPASNATQQATRNTTESTSIARWSRFPLQTRVAFSLCNRAKTQLRSAFPSTKTKRPHCQWKTAGRLMLSHRNSHDCIDAQFRLPAAKPCVFIRRCDRHTCDVSPFPDPHAACAGRRPCLKRSAWQAYPPSQR